MKVDLLQLACKAPLLYTTWTIVFAGAVLVAVALGKRSIRSSIWRAAYALLLGACFAGTVMVNIYHKPIMEKYNIPRSILVLGDLVFHIVPLLLLLWGGKKMMLGFSQPDNNGSLWEMMAIVATVAGVYMWFLNTAMYPGDPRVLVPICLASTAVSVWYFAPNGPV